MYVNSQLNDSLLGLAAFIATVLAFTSMPSSATELMIEVARIRQMEHIIYLRVDPISDENLELNELPDALLETKMTPVSKTETLHLGELNPGRYMVSLFQDMNGNGVLDLDKKGRPIEPYGLSNNPILLKAPVLKNSVFELSGDTKVVKIRLRNKKRRGREE